MAWKLSNFAQSTLRQSVLAAATTMYIDADEVDTLPTLGVGDKAKAVLFNESYREIVNITTWVTDGTLTVERAQESTAARDWAAGTKVIHTPTAEILQTVINATQNITFFGTMTNVSNAFTVNTGGGSIPALANNDTVRAFINADNTGASTLVVTNGTTSTAAKNILHQDGQALQDGDLQAGWMAEFVYSVSSNAWIVLDDTSFNEHAYQINDGPVPAVSRHPNGRLDFWRGGSSFATPASLSETADGWVPQYDGSIGTFSISRQAFTLGQTQVPWSPKYFLRWDQTVAGSGSTLRRLRVKLPGVHWRGGEQVSRGIYLKADTSRTVTGKIIQHFGTGGAPSADVEASTAAWSVTTSWTRFEVSPTLPSISGKTLGSNNDDGLYLTLDLPLNVVMTIDVAVDDIRSGHIAGRQSDTFPLPWGQGGTGGSYADLADFILDSSLVTISNFTTNFPDLNAIEVLAGTSGILAKTAANSWALRNLAVGTGLTVTNPAGVAGDPTVGLGTALTNYNADPLSIAELASITAAFGTAAFVNTGTSGTTVPLLSTAWTNADTITVNKAAGGASQVIVGGSNAQDAYLILNANAGQFRRTFLRSGGTNRYHYGLDSVAESGADAGSNFVITALSDAAVARTELTLSRATGSWTFGGVLLNVVGSAANPSIAAIADTNTGIKFPGSDVLDFVTTGVVRMSVNAAGQMAATGLASASTPEYSFLGDENNGVRRTGADAGALVSGGVDVVKWDSAGAKDSSNTLWQVGGKHMIPLPASGWRAQSTNGPAAYLAELTTNRQMVEGFAFDAATDEFIQFSMPMPKSWDEGTITARFRWTAPSGTGNVVWGIQLLAVSDDDAMDAAWGTAQTVTDTLLAVNDMHTTSETAAITAAGSPAEGDVLWARVYRDADNASDTFSADAVLMAVDLFISLNGANDV